MKPDFFFEVSIDGSLNMHPTATVKSFESSLKSGVCDEPDSHVSIVCSNM